MVINVVSRSRVNDFIEYVYKNFHRNFYHISIWGDGMKPLEINHPNLIQLNFDDITDKQKVMFTETKFENLIMFNEQHAIEIINFLKLIKSQKNVTGFPTHLVVNCMAGISRSGAVGKFANLYLHYDCFDNEIEMNDFKFNEEKMLMTTMPNNYIFSKLNEVLQSKFNESIYCS